MHSFVQHILLIWAHLGAAGLVLMGILDSSFLFMPLGNDLLIVGLTVAHHNKLPLYVAMAALGSTAGSLLLDLVARKGGEEGLKRLVSPKRLDYLKKKIKERAAAALAVASLAPPPFPFTAVVAAASAFGYSRWKLLAVIAGFRVIRFTIVGLLAIWMGRRILTIANTPAFEWGVIAFVALCTIGSAASIYEWVRRSKSEA